MEAIAAKLAKIAKASLVLKPEQAIQGALLELARSSSEKVHDSQLESILISLLHVNNGDLTVSCSISIGKHLSDVFSAHSKGQFWSLITDVTDNPTFANILALRYVVKKLGHASKNSLSSVTKTLIEKKTPKKLMFPRLACLASLFKVCGDSLKGYANAAFSLANSQISEQNENVQIAGLSLCRSLLQFGVVSRRKVLNLIEYAFDEALSPFVISEAGKVAALYASMQFVQQETSVKDDNLILSGKHQKNEKNSAFQDGLSIIARFNSHFTIIFAHFLEFLKPEFIFNNISELFAFVKQHSPGDIPRLTAYFGKNVRANLFGKFFDTKDLPMLRLLTFDDDTARRCSGIAHDWISSRIPEQRANAGSFFVSLAVSYPHIAMESLQLALKYVAMPPETSIAEFEGMASTVAIILSTFGPEFEFDYEMKQYFGKFVSDCLNANVKHDAFLISLFMISATVDDHQIPTEAIKPVLDTLFRRVALELTKEKPDLPIRLIECVLVFLSEHPGFTIAKEFNQLCYKVVAKLTHVGHFALLRSITSVKMDSDFYQEASLLYVNLALGLSVPLDYVKKRIPNLMKLPEEVLRIQQRGKQLKELTGSAGMFFVDSSSLAAKICDSLPLMVAHLSTSDIGKLLTLAINAENRVMGHLLILALYQNKETAKKLPSQFDDCLIQVLDADNIVALQITSECIAYHLEQHSSRLPAVMSYVRDNETVCSCVLEAAIARRLVLSDSNVMEIIFRMSKRLLVPELTNVVLQEMASIYETKSIQLVSMLMGDQQCQSLLDLLNSSSSISLYTYHLISVCLEKLVPILLPNLQSQETVDMVLIALECLKLSPIPIMKRYFFESFRAVSAFSKTIATAFKVRLPHSPLMPIETKLAVCGALADLSKVRPFSISIDAKMPSLLVLLQRTGDKRVYDLIVAAAVCFSKKCKKAQDLVQWFQMTKALLSGNTMFGFGNAQVEPNVIVKCCALNVIKVLLADLARMKPFQASCLDDLMTSTIRALESGRAEVYSIAYTILKDVISRFRDVRTEANCGLLELYESQFSIAIRYSFPGAVDEAADFHCVYLDFYFKVYETDLKSCLMLLETYIRCLSSVRVKTSGYYAITSKICAIARKRSSVADEIRAFLETLVVPYSELIIDSIKLRTVGADWAQISRYREKISSFYGDLLTSTVWLRKLFEPQDNLPIPVFASFLLFELTSGSEGWRSLAAFSALTVFLEHFSGDITPNMCSLVVNTMCHVSKWNAKLLSDAVPEFLMLATALTGPDSELWIALCSTASTHHCSGVPLGRILKFTPREVISKSVGTLGESVLDSLKNGFLEESEAVAAFTVLFDYCPDAIPVMLPRIVALDGFVGFVLKVLNRAYARVETRVAIDKIALFFAKNITTDAMKVLGRISVRRKAIASEIMRRGVASAYLMHSFKEGEGVLALNLFSAILSCLGSYKIVCDSVAMAAMSVLKTDGSSHLIGEQVACLAVKLINMCDATYELSSLDAFQALGDREKEDLKRILRRHASKKRVRKVSLVKFSTRPRRSTVSNSQDLESVELD